MWSQDAGGRNYQVQKMSSWARTRTSTIISFAVMVGMVVFCIPSASADNKASHNPPGQGSGGGNSGGQGGGNQGQGNSGNSPGVGGGTPPGQGGTPPGQVGNSGGGSSGGSGETSTTTTTTQSTSSNNDSYKDTLVYDIELQIGISFNSPLKIEFIEFVGYAEN